MSKAADPNLDPGVNGLGRSAPPPLRDIEDREVPTTAEGFAQLLRKGVTRALNCATISKDITEAVKAGTELYELLYGKDEPEEPGSKLNGGNKNGR